MARTDEKTRCGAAARRIPTVAMVLGLLGWGGGGTASAQETVRTRVELPPVELAVFDCTDLLDAACEGEEPEARVAWMEAFVGFARTWARPAFDPVEEDLKSLGRGRLVGLLRPATRDWVERLLAEVRERVDRPEFFAIEARWLEVDPRTFAAHVAPLLEGGDAEEGAGKGAAGADARPGRPPSALLAPGPETQRFVRELARTSESLAAPRILAKPFSEAALQSVERVNYLKDYDIERVGGSLIVNPQLGTVEPGFELKVRVGRLPGREGGGGGENQLLGVEVESVVRRLLAMPRHEVELRDMPGLLEEFPELSSKDGTKVWIQLPQIASARATTDLRMPSGSTLLLVVPGKGESGGHRLLMLHVAAQG